MYAHTFGVYVTAHNRMFIRVGDFMGKCWHICWHVSRCVCMCDSECEDVLAELSHP